MLQTRRLARNCTAALLAVAALTLALASPAHAGTGGSVPVPEVEGPIVGGSRTGGPFWATPFDLAPYGYVEEEYFLSGVASTRGLTGAETTAPYKVRILLRRPVNAARFNGTAALEWANVSFQNEIEHDWPLDWAMMMRDGYVSAMVSAQQTGVQGPGPFALKNWDPQRYGSLNHPGDDYSYDIYAQAAQAIRSGRVVNYLPVNIILGTGTSQSCGRLLTYIPKLAAKDQVFDGFHPTLCPATADIPDDLVPMLWGNSETEVYLASRPDGPLLRVWEIPGAHLNYYETSMGQVQLSRDAGLGAGRWDEDAAGQYGERGSVLVAGTAPDSVIFGNTFPTRYAFRAGLDHLNTWARQWKEYRAGSRTLGNVTPAPSAPRFSVTAPGNVQRDAHGNAVGGVPQPALQVPVATYVTLSFGGGTVPFDPATLLLLYPTHEDYVSKMQAATDKNVADGFMLPKDAAEWMARVKASPIGSVPVSLWKR